MCHCAKSNIITSVLAQSNFLHYLANMLSSSLVILRLLKITKYHTLLGFSQQNLGLDILPNILENNVFYFFIHQIFF